MWDYDAIRPSLEQTTWDAVPSCGSPMGGELPEGAHLVRISPCYSVGKEPTAYQSNPGEEWNSYPVYCAIIKITDHETELRSMPGQAPVEVELVKGPFAPPAP